MKFFFLCYRILEDWPSWAKKMQRLRGQEISLHYRQPDLFQCNQNTSIDESFDEKFLCSWTLYTHLREQANKKIWIIIISTYYYIYLLFFDIEILTANHCAMRQQETWLLMINEGIKLTEEEHMQVNGCGFDPHLYMYLLLGSSLWTFREAD